MKITQRLFKILNPSEFHLTNGTHLQGYLTTTYEKLLEILGTPQEGSDKTNVEWAIQFEDGKVATIYDWKLSSVPSGLYDWHVGGHSLQILDHLEEALDIPTRVNSF